MANIIVFLSLFIVYIIFTSIYIRKEQLKLININNQISKLELEAEIRYIVRNVMYLTGIIFISNSYVLLGRDFNAKITASQIGLILAVGTVVFYIVFTVWDVMKYKINNYFIDNYNIEVDRKVLFSGVHIIIIVLFSTLLLEFVLSIITLLAL